MVRLVNRLKVINFLLIAVMLFEAVPMFARGGEEDPKVQNVRVQPAGPMIYIYYDLTGPPQQVYEVSVTVRSRTDSTFQYSPLNLSGDVGTNVFSGVDWRISWSFAKEFPAGLKDEYYLVVSAKVIADQVSAGWMRTEYYIAGGAVVAGGVVALILLGKKKETTPIVVPGFPAPPGRP
jgi:hypothetical protein